DLASAFQSRVGRNYPAWFSRFSRGVIWFTEKRLGIAVKEVSPAQEIDKLAPAPVLLLAGSDDPHASAGDMARLFQLCREPRTLEIIPGAGHEDVCAKGGEFYKERVLGFLEQYM